MKYANYDKTTGELLGYYDTELHETIPESSLQITDEQWHEALDKGYNYVDATNKTLGFKDFRTFTELQTAKKQEIKGNLQNYLKSYTLADGTIIKNSMQDQTNSLKNIALSQQSLTSPKWEASVSVALNSVAFIGNTLCICTTAGKTDSSEPTAPTDFSTALSDGTAVWKKLGFLVNTGKGRVYYTPQDILKISQEVALILNEALTKYDILKGQIKAATNEDELSKITW